MRIGGLLLVVILLAGCAGSGGDAGWPGQHSEDPTEYDFPVVQKRWDAASRVPLGSAQDVTEVMAALQKAHPDMVIHEIRWISAKEAMALVVRGEGIDLGQESFYCALVKSDNRWRVVAWYSDIIS